MFGEVNEDAIHSLLDSKDSKSTKRSIAGALKRFRFFYQVNSGLPILRTFLRVNSTRT